MKESVVLSGKNKDYTLSSDLRKPAALLLIFAIIVVILLNIINTFILS